MSVIKINKGLDLPIDGKPEQKIELARASRSVGVIGSDFSGMKPTMHVQEGDKVNSGQVLFSDKKNEGVVFTAPSAGIVSGINRGEKRSLLSVTIDVEEGPEEEFQAHDVKQLDQLNGDAVREQLVKSGQWIAFRTRPFSRVPAIDASPNSIFVTAMNSDPLGLDPAVVVKEAQQEFESGLLILTRLTEGKVYVCSGEGFEVAVPDHEGISGQVFSGPHPAGLAGTHIHHLDPVGPNKTVWYLDFQEVIAFGHLFLTGKVMTQRVVALAGPGVSNPRLLRASLGANLTELVAGEVKEGEQRVISGSVLSGRGADSPVDYLGRYHHQVAVLGQNKSRDLFGYLSVGTKKHSVFPVFLSKWLGEKAVEFTTSTNGSPRAMVPIGTYDTLIPMDILATQLLRSLLVGDIESAINLGCLELDEEDIALCTYSCPGKYEYGPVLREMLTQIEREG